MSRADIATCLRSHITFFVELSNTDAHPYGDYPYRDFNPKTWYIMRKACNTLVLCVEDLVQKNPTFCFDVYPSSESVEQVKCEILRNFSRIYQPDSAHLTTVQSYERRRCDQIQRDRCQFLHAFTIVVGIHCTATRPVICTCTCKSGPHFLLRHVTHIIQKTEIVPPSANCITRQQCLTNARPSLRCRHHYYHRLQPHP